MGDPTPPRTPRPVASPSPLRRVLAPVAPIAPYDPKPVSPPASKTSSTVRPGQTESHPYNSPRGVQGMPNMGKGRNREKPRHGNPAQTMGIPHGKGEGPAIIGNTEPPSGPKAA